MPDYNAVQAAKVTDEQIDSRRLDVLDKCNELALQSAESTTMALVYLLEVVNGHQAMHKAQRTLNRLLLALFGVLLAIDVVWVIGVLLWL